MTPDSPFAPVHSRESFFESTALTDALRRLGDGLGAREPFVLVTGEPGTGKSALVSQAIAHWGTRVTAAFVAFPALTGAELLEEIHRRFGAEPAEGASRSRLVAGIERALASAAERGQVAVVIVDDAHGLAPELLEELRLLANAARQVGSAFEVVLVGLPALEATFDQPGLATLRQRVSVRVRLEPLSAADTQRYIHHRVSAVGGDGPGLFSRKTCRDIATLSHGVPRQIGSLAAEALRLARAASAPTVEPAHVRAAAATLWGEAAASTARKGALLEPEVRTVPIDQPATTSADQPAPRAHAQASDKPAPATAPGTRAHVPDKPAPTYGAPPSRRPAPAPGAHAHAPDQPAPAPGAPPSRKHAPGPDERVPAPDTPPPTVAAPASASDAAPRPPRVESRANVEARSIQPMVKQRESAPGTAPEPAAHDFEPQPAPVVPAAQDPREWVARFIGDQGPVQIGSQSFADASWDHEASDAAHEAAPASLEARPESPKRGRSPHAPAWRGRHRAWRAASSVSIAALLVLAVVAVVMRAAGGARGRAANVTSEAVGTRSAEPVTAPSATRSASALATQNGIVPTGADRIVIAGAPTSGSARTSSAATTRATQDSAAASRTRYTVDVGGYLDLDRALRQRDRLRALTGIDAWVVPASESGAETHRVVIGIFRTSERATAAAGEFLAANTSDEATVVPLPSRRARR